MATWIIAAFTFTIVLAVATIVYVFLVKRHLDPMKRQLSLLRRHDRERAVRAVQAIVAEVESNHAELRQKNPEQRGPLLVDAFPASPWALAGMPVGEEAVAAIRNGAHARLEVQRRVYGRRNGPNQRQPDP